MKGTTIAVLAACGAVLLWLRSRQAPAPMSLNEVPNGADWAVWWSFAATGEPSTAGSRGTGIVTPGTITERLGNVFRGDGIAWSNPTAGTSIIPALAANPAGSSRLFGVAAPAQPTGPAGVSTVEAPAPLNLQLSGPVSASPWFFELSLVDPVAAWRYGGSMFDSELLTRGA